MRDDNTSLVSGRPQKQSSIWRWLLPLLILLIAAGLLFNYMNSKKDTADTSKQTRTNTSTSTEQSTQTQSSSGTVTDLATLLSATDTSSVIGKKVTFANATVDQVIGDKSFTLGSGTDHIYALLSDKLDSGQTEQTVRVQAGETRSIQGTVVKAPVDMATLMNQFQLTEAQANELKAQGFYISVTQTAVVTENNSSSDMPTGAGTE